MAFNTEVLKEPRGFIKFLEIVIAIFAFATTASHHSFSQFTAECPDGATHKVNLDFGYSYRLENTFFTTPVCNTTANATQKNIHLYGNYSSSAEFYVFVGVMAFLYSLAAMTIYMLLDDHYQQNEKVPMIDFIITLVFSALWLISSSAWADAVTKIKHYTNPEDVIFDKEHGSYHECQDTSTKVKCEVTALGNFASLNVSIIFGFLNMLVWAGNLWFLYKETKWFKSASKQSPDYSSPGTPQRM